jgi:hypothetical protein
MSGTPGARPGMIDPNLAKVGVEGSNPFARSNKIKPLRETDDGEGIALSFTPLSRRAGLQGCRPRAGSKPTATRLCGRKGTDFATSSPYEQQPGRSARAASGPRRDIVTLEDGRSGKSLIRSTSPHAITRQEPISSQPSAAFRLRHAGRRQAIRIACLPATSFGMRRLYHRQGRADSLPPHARCRWPAGIQDRTQV